jgi:ABC-2 type transport system ATP-binding protein
MWRSAGETGRSRRPNHPFRDVHQDYGARTRYPDNPMQAQDTRAAIAVHHLSKYYGAFVAVEGVSFSVRAGELVALLGPNGAGKTTLMRILTGYLPPSAGRARIAGFDLGTDRIAAAAAIGYLPENGPLYPDMTARESLQFLADARGLAGASFRERLQAVARACDIEGILDKPAGKLSKGLRQRVGMAQAVLHDPPILILDEPTAGLDPIQIRQFRSHIRELAGKKTVLVSTHILQEVDAIADRLLVISRGRLVFDGGRSAIAPESLDDLFHRLTAHTPMAS